MTPNIDKLEVPALGLTSTGACFRQGCCTIHETTIYNTDNYRMIQT